MVFGHVYQNSVSHNFIFSFHMPLFFMVAGWLYREIPVRQNIKHKFCTVMIPYFSFGLLTLIYWQLIERRFRASDMTFLQSLIGLIRGEYDFLDFNVHLWFLPCFFLTVVIYNGLRNVVGRRGTYIVAICLSAVYVIGVYSSFVLPSLPWGLNRVCQYIGFYAIGNWMSELGVNGKVEAGRRTVWAVIATAVLAAVFTLSLSESTIGIDLTTGVFWFITGTLGTVAVGIYSILLSGLRASIINNLISFLGRISLVVLCVHGPVYRVISKVLSVVIGWETDAVRSNFFFAVVIVIITLAVCSIAYMVIDRLMPWMIGKPRRRKATVKETVAATVSMRGRISE